MAYHRLNLVTDGKDVNNFKTVRNSKIRQLTVTVSFTKLDIIVKSKKGNDYLMNNQQEYMYWYLESKSCGIMAKNIQYYIQHNTSEIDRRWMGIKVT